MLTINAEIRKEQGKGASRRLRKNNKLPAIVYGGDQEPVSIELNHDEVINQESKPEFYEVLTLVVDGKKTKVKVQAVQRHPFKPKLTHIDFLRV
ncbi:MULTISPECIES: 50S ribosomal protein L25 [Arsenophonus]|jgi:large subunit ribosomal protein L25|uniref:Large ribosomal subunit protein bL25 n=1 Tax=Arsenophonus apicola TaxID=2879119 RepID=A0ABY8P6K5_9GAMM|nr:MULTISPECIES: 50S ribosomal protein L25 [Arsenophonus]UBX30123.1 50S ribosomal protein L25 [Arsenophonus apicola]WGL97330.1 50S ribosomal protein L25 [Arsenophonus sp. aPb]WGO84581.1 50S ribosomal protein L25 [Arsenophonus apicola]